MSGPAIVWLIVGLVTTAAVLALLVALVRHVIVLGRALGRFQQEVSPIAADIAAAGERASARSRSASAGLRAATDARERGRRPPGEDPGVP